MGIFVDLSFTHHPDLSKKTSCCIIAALGITFQLEIGNYAISNLPFLKQPCRKMADEVIPGVYCTSLGWGAAMIWGCCSCSGAGSATLCTQRIRSADYLNDHVIYQWICYSLTA